MPWPHPPGARPDVRVRSATIKVTAPLMVEVRAVGGAVVYSSNDTEIPGDQFVHVERTPHIMRAIREGDLEQRSRPPEQPTAKDAAAPPKASDPVATAPSQNPTKQATKVPKPARSAPKRAATPKRKAAKRRTKQAKRQDKLRREMARSIIERVNPKGYANRTIAHLTRQVRNEKNWKAECEARSIDPKDLEPQGRDTVARAAGRRRD